MIAMGYQYAASSLNTDPVLMRRIVMRFCSDIQLLLLRLVPLTYHESPPTPLVRPLRQTRATVPALDELFTRVWN